MSELPYGASDWLAFVGTRAEYLMIRGVPRWSIVRFDENFLGRKIHVKYRCIEDVRASLEQEVFSLLCRRT